MADRLMYDKMLEEDMFSHLLALNPPNLAEIHPKQNLLRIFFGGPLEKNFFFVNSSQHFFFVVGVLPGMARKV